MPESEEKKRERFKRWYNSPKGKAHYQKKLKEKVDVICPTCNTVFQKIGNSLQKYCNKKCNKGIYKASDLERTLKECNECNQILPINKFSLVGIYGGRRGKCKECYLLHIQKRKGTIVTYTKEKLYREELHILQKENKRRCRLCNEIKYLDDFHTDNSHKVFYNKKSYCKKCARNQYARPYLQSFVGREKKSKWDKKYSLKPETIEKRNKKHMERYYSDIEYKILYTLRGRMKTVFKSKNLLKKNRTVELMGCTVREAMEHIEKQFKDGMGWHNHGKNGWHIDHIIPCASFDLIDPEQQKKCFHYTNLQPLWAFENLSKGKKIITNDF
jgi:hypothetical protein